MIVEVQSLLDQYWTWLKDQTILRKLGQWVEITTPYLDRHNDFLQIYAKRSGGMFILTDDGYTVTDLEQSGCALDSPRRKDLLTITLNGFGVQMNETSKALEVRTSEANFALRKHNLVQAMLAVNDLFYLASPTVANLFYEDVVAWLDDCDIRYTPNVRFSGRSGYDHRFDFVIPKSRRQPERVVRAINRPSRETAQAMTFAWLDTKEVRSPEARAYAMVNDSDGPISQSVLDAMHSYDVQPISWSDREKTRGELAA